MTLLLALLAAAPLDHLEAENGVLADFGFAAYETALAKALHRDGYREVELVTVPSFQAEQAVYVQSTSGEPPQVVSVRLKSSLWSTLNERLKAGSKDGSYSMSDEAIEQALRGFKAEVVVTTAPLSPTTLAKLKAVWTTALLATRPPQAHGGLDGVTYHFADFTTGVGYRSGKTWSPPSGSRLDALVALATKLSDYTRAPAAERATLDQALARDADALLLRLHADKPAK